MIDPAQIRTVLCAITGAMDIVAVFVIIVCQQVTTADFGISNKPQIWSLIKRAMYWMAATAFLFLGVYRFRNIGPISLMDSIPHIAVVIYTIFFPILRARGIISPDVFLDGNGVRHTLGRVTE